MPAISVIIPTYQRSGTVLETLASVFAQTFSDYEVIVVNDGSPDDTGAVLAPFVTAGRIRYCEQANRGAGAARNRGLFEARGEFVAFLDDDDLWPIDKLRWQVEYLTTRPEAGVVAGSCQRFSTDGLVGVPIGGDAVLITAERISQGNPFVSPGQTLIRTTYLREVGGFDEMLCGVEDMDLWFRFALRWRIDYVPKVALEYRLHSTNASSDRLRLYQSSFRMIRKHLRLAMLSQRRQLGTSYYTWLHNYLGRPIAFSYLLRAVGRRSMGPGLLPSWRGLPSFVGSLASSRCSVVLMVRDIAPAVIRALLRSKIGSQHNIRSPFSR